jgi:ERCC4-type nuclease
LLDGKDSDGMIANKTDRFSFHYTDMELKKLLSTLVILVDTREQVNEHILTFLNEKKITYDRVKLDTGDYSCKVPRNEELWVIRDLYLPACIERQNSIDELAKSIKEERFEFELIRGQRLLLITLLQESGRPLIRYLFVLE